MKRLLTLPAALLICASAVANPVTPAKAIKIAQDFEVPGHAMKLTMPAKPRRVKGASEPVSPYYVISRGANQGYVIVAGDDCLPEILGYTEQGDFDESNIPDGLQDMLDVWQSIVEKAQETGQNAARSTFSRREAQRRASERPSIAPLLTSHWHQDSPYNDRCPFIPGTNNRAVCGCVATAASQVIYYYRNDNPTAFNANTPTYGTDEWHEIAVTESIKKGTPLKWGLMLDRYSGSEPADYHSAVADLVYGIGTMAHMGYSANGSGAQIWDLVNPLKSFFNLYSEYVSKDNRSTATWEKMIYDDLTAGHPMVYSGHNDDNEGHAVVLDGYQSSTGLFHFNFGWGGQGDGWYTVDNETGMNGFHVYQEITYKIHPLTPNVKASIQLPEKVYVDRTAQIVVNVTNHSTFDVSGIYLFAATSNTKPAKLTAAKSNDTETVIAKGETKEIALSMKPTTERDWYITITDANLNVLAKATVTPAITKAALHFESLSLDGSPDKETLDGKEFQIVYHDKTTASATLSNASLEGYEGVLRMQFYSYNEITKGWDELGYKTGQIQIDPLASGEAKFNVTSTTNCPFELGKYYMGKLVNPIPNSDDVIDYGTAAEANILFVFKENDMEVVDYDEGCLTLKGCFDNTAFNTTLFANKSSYKRATVYDLTQCTNINHVSQTVNPNALIYVADDSKANGENVICAGKCANLSLVPGYDFTPRTEFVAEKAKISLQAKPAEWVLLTSPFKVAVPDGIIAREIMEHSTTGISNATNDVQMLEAGKTYLVMTSSSRNVTFVAENVKVLAAPVANTDEAVVGTFINTATPADAQLIENMDKPAFVPVEEGTVVEALRGYWYASDLKKSFRAYPSILLDPAYQTLAENIEQAYLQLDKYSKVTRRAAYNAYLEKIHAAEHEFSHRGENETMLSSATLVKNYANQLLYDGNKYMRQIARLGNMEIDFTDLIVNPSFETNSTKGWTLGKKEGYAAVGGVVNGTAANNNRAVGLDGTYVFQSFIAKADSTSVGISQVVEGLTPGYYKLTALVATDESETVTLFAGDKTTTVDGHAFGGLYLTEATINDVLVEATDGIETGSLTIGVQAGRWYKVDDFKLTYVKTIADIIEEPDAITDVEMESVPMSKGIFTLQGTKALQMSTPGLYIVDGKKVYRP